MMGGREVVCRKKKGSARTRLSHILLWCSKSSFFSYASRLFLTYNQHVLLSAHTLPKNGLTCDFYRTAHICAKTSVNSFKTRVSCFLSPPLLDGDTGSLLSLSGVVQERLWASADQVGLRGEVLHGEAGKY